MVQRQPQHIHPVESKNDVGNGHQNGDGAENLHGDVEVVGDHGGKCVHHTGDDGGIDLRHLDGLAHLDEHVLQKIVVLLVQRDNPPSENLFQGHLVGLQ